MSEQVVPHKKTLFFRDWLAIQVRPFWRGILFLWLILSFLIFVFEFKREWNVFTNSADSFTRSAELVLPVRNLILLESFALQFREAYSSAHFVIHEKNSQVSDSSSDSLKVLWNFPSGEIPYHSFLSHREVRSLLNNKNLEVVFYVHYSDIFKQLFLVFSYIFVLFLISVFVLAKISKRISAGVNKEVEAMKTKQTSSVKEFSLLLGELDKLQSVKCQLESQVEFGKLAVQVAHDIRSPLTALEMLERDCDELGVENKQLLQMVTNRIRSIANDLLEKNKNEITPCSLSEMIQAVIAEKLLQLKNQPSIELSFSGIPDNLAISDEVLVSSVAFKRILSNLLNNAIEALGEKGNITIQLKTLEERLLEVQIQDNGKGIPPEILSQLGRKGATFGKVRGSGLGLYSAKEQVEKWGGQIEIMSQLGKGTTVRITLNQAGREYCKSTP